MPSKTPKFEAAINEILNDLKPHKKNCKQCGVVFDVFLEDIEFYKKFQVPTPTLCPDCRLHHLAGPVINKGVRAKTAGKINIQDFVQLYFTD